VSKRWNPPGPPGTPKLVTNLEIAGSGQWFILALLALAPLLLGRGAAEWIAIAVLELAAVAAWWLRVGRYWHPILELRWYARHRPPVTGADGVTVKGAAFQTAWNLTHGRPFG
jgi:hypothetical protein